MMKTCAGRFKPASEFASPLILRYVCLVAGLVIAEYVLSASSGCAFLSYIESQILPHLRSGFLLGFYIVCGFFASLLRFISTNLSWNLEIGLVCLCSRNGVAEQ